MPEYLAPGVFVEETSFRSKSIEGVSTTTTGFVGPCRYGPIDLPNEVVTSLVEFERSFGDRRQLAFSDAGTLHNYLWHGVRTFFEEGGKRLYVSRTFRNRDGNAYTGYLRTTPIAGGATNYTDGHARALLAPGGALRTLLVRARYPGAWGNLRVSFTLRASQNVLAYQNDAPVLRSVLDRDVVVVSSASSPPLSPPGADSFLTARWDDVAQDWYFQGPNPGDRLALETLTRASAAQVRIVTVTVTVTNLDDGISLVYPGLALDPQHERSGALDSLSSRFSWDTDNQAHNADVPVVIDRQQLVSGTEILTALFTAALTSPPSSPPVDVALENPDSTDDERTVSVLLRGGNDGNRPTADDYAGQEIVGTTRKTGLMQFENLDDISIIAAPGSTFGYDNGYGLSAATIVNELISHCERMRYRVAVLDSGNGQTIGQVRAMRARIDSSHAALYYPWVKVLDPVTAVPIYLPPSGFVSGIYARNDVNRAVYKAPANETVSALGFELLLNKAQQEVLNPEGINAFRFFEDRGFRLWGARTTSSDPEWKYVNVRRYFVYLEHSIDKGTQWAVFEPNGEALWANVRRTIDDFLLNEWQKGALLGEKPELAYFVKCDRSTMTQNDLDNGRLIALIGVAPLKPAEFVIFRIGQWTGDRK